MAKQAIRPTFGMIKAELASADVHVRKEAIRQMARFYPAVAVEPLLKILQDARADVRTKAVKALAQLKDQRALASLLNLLNDPKPSVREKVVWALGELDDPRAVPLLQDLLNGPDARLRPLAARSLGRLRDPRSLSSLVAYLQRAGNRSVECDAAVRAMGDFGTPDVIKPLLAQLLTPSGGQTVIAHTLSRLDERATPILLTILVDPQYPLDIRECVTQALCQTPRSGMIPSLIHALDQESASVRLHAVQVLRTIEDPAVVEPLIVFLNDPRLNEGNERERIDTINALASFDAINVVKALVGCLSDQGERVQVAAIKALGRLRATYAVAELVACLADENEHIQRAALVALGQVRPTKAYTSWGSLAPHIERAVLIDYLLDEDERVQLAAVNGLAEIGSARAIEPLHTMLSQTSGDLHDAVSLALIRLEAVFQKEN
jgi:HEAT repeat protein